MLQGDRGKQLPRGFAPHHLGPPPVRPQTGKALPTPPYQAPNGQFAPMPMSRPPPALNSLPIQSPLYRSAGMLPGVPVAAVRIPSSANPQSNNSATITPERKSRMAVPVESYESDPSAIYDGTSAQFAANGQPNASQGQFTGSPLPITQIDYSTQRQEPQFSLETLQDSDRIRIRTEADRIAERLLKTEADLERLRKQGDLIGESLRKQKLHDMTSSFSSSSTLSAVQNVTEDLLARSQGPPPARPRSPLSRSRAVEDPLSISFSGQTDALHRERTSISEKDTILSPSKNFQGGQEFLGNFSPTRANNIDSSLVGNSSPKRLNFEGNVSQMMQPPGGTLQTLSGSADPFSPGRANHSTTLAEQTSSVQKKSDPPPRPAPPTLANKIELAQKQLSAEECAKLGLPPGTMWFDPNSKAQMKLITDQLKASKAEAAAKAAGGASNADLHNGAPGRIFPTGPISKKTYTEDEIRAHYAKLYLPDRATLSQVFGAYKRLAPRAYAAGEQEGGDFSELAQITESYKCCEAVAIKLSEKKVGSLTTIGEDEEEDNTPLSERDIQPSIPVDIHQLYRDVFSANIKKGELHVQLGVTLEDLVVGFKANFTYERMVCMEDGSVQPDKCQLCIDIVPGMRPGLEFVFENEGDDAPGHVPGDVKVTLYAEPHTRFFWAGNDLATQVTISLASALLGGAVGEVKSITNQILSLNLPMGTIIHPGAVFKVRGEGLPISEDSRARGDLFVRFMVEFPKSLGLSSEETQIIRTQFSHLSPGINNIHSTTAEAPTVTQVLEPAIDQEFGKGYPIVHQMTCAQQ